MNHAPYVLYGCDILTDVCVAGFYTSRPHLKGSTRRLEEGLFAAEAANGTAPLRHEVATFRTTFPAWNGPPCVFF